MFPREQATLIAKNLAWRSGEEYMIVKGHEHYWLVRRKTWWEENLAAQIEYEGRPRESFHPSKLPVERINDEAATEAFKRVAAFERLFAWKAAARLKRQSTKTQEIGK